MLLGRVRRPSIGSLVELEMERPSPKIIKDDPLSIYETTLMKLKEGSQRCQNLRAADAMSTDVSCVSTTDSTETTGDVCSFTSSVNSIGEQASSTSSPTEQRNKTPSVLSLFSKYKSAKKNPRSPDEDVMLMETVCSSRSTSPRVSSSELMSSQMQPLSEECFESEMETDQGPNTPPGVSSSDIMSSQMQQLSEECYESGMVDTDQETNSR